MRTQIGLFLKVTHKCNMNCTYCYDKKTISEQQSMKIDKFKRIIEKAAKDYDRINIMFHGGEPLVLGLEWFKEAIDYCKKTKKEFTYSLQSNSLLLTQEWIDFFKENKVEYGVSYDGLCTHKYRKISSDKILDQLRLANDNNIRPGIATVCNKEFLQNIINEYENLKAVTNNVRLNYLFGVDVKPDYYELYIAKLKTLFDYWILDQEAISVTEMIMPLEFLASVPSNQYACLNCHTAWIGIDYDGLVGLCDFGVIPRSVNMGYIDDYDSMLDIAYSEFKLSHIKRITDRMQECFQSGCELAGKCSGGCNARRYYQPSFNNTDFYCMIVKELYAHAKQVLSHTDLEQCNRFAKDLLKGRRQ